MDQVQLDLELLTLLDLGAIGLQKHMRFRGLARYLAFYAGCASSRHAHLRADGTQLRHDLAMHGTGLVGLRSWQLDADGFFDTKTLAMNRHGTLPEPNSLEF